MAVLDILGADVIAAIEHDRALQQQPSMWRRTPVMVAMLLAVYLVASLFTDPAGHLITDVGGKSATLEAMVQRGDWDVDLGYWFEDADPEGVHYPYAHTALTPNGQWVNTTSLTMIYPMRPLWALGGARLALLIPILGAVATAAAAAALERRLNPQSNGTWSFWTIGLATPTFIYALDLWEHTLGLAAMTIGAVAVHDTINNRHPNTAAAIAGLGYGFAATMRQEALVYGLIAGLLVTITTYRQHNTQTAIIRSTIMATATIAMLATHTLAEYTLLGGPLRLQRSTGTIAAGETLAEKADGAALIVVALFNGTHPVSHVFGVLFAVGLVWLTMDVLHGRSPHGSKLLVIVLSAVFVLLLAVELRPVPGLVAATPLAAIGLAAAIHFHSRFSIIIAVAPLPIILAVQFTAGAAFQWGGRYVLLTGVVLTVAAIALLGPRYPRFLAAAVAGSLAITLYGVVWADYRMDRATDDRATLVALTTQDDVVIWRDAATAREMGSEALDRRWLGAAGQAEQSALAGLLLDEGIESFVWIDELGTVLESFGGFEPVGEFGRLELFEQRLTRYTRTNQ